MAVRATESSLPAGKTASDLGEAASIANAAGGFALVSYLTSPLYVGSRQDYVLFSLPSGTTDPVDVENYTWTAVAHPSGFVYKTATTDIGMFDWTPAAAGSVGGVKVSVELDTGATPAPKLVLTQNVVPPSTAGEDFFNRVWGAGSIDPTIPIVREIINDLHPYIKASVLAHTPTTVPTSMVAAALFIEMLARYREGTPEAAAYRKALEEGKGVNEKGFWEKNFGREDDLIREVELELIATYINGEFRPVDAVAQKSIGLGQVQQVTAAIVLGLTTWEEKKGGGPDPATQAKIVDAYKALTLKQKIGIFNSLRFPKTSIDIVVDYLDKLKKRLHRWPAQTRAQFRANQNGCEIVGTEYNIGARMTPAATAKPTGHGKRLWKLMQPSSPLGPDIFFPEPP